MVQIMIQPNSTRTNPKKAGTSKEKGNGGQEGTSHKTAFLHFNGETGLSLGRTKDWCQK